MGEDNLKRNNKVKSGTQTSFDKSTSPDQISAKMDLGFIRQRLDILHKDILNEVDRKLSTTIDEILQQIRQKELQTNEFNNFAENHSKKNSTWSNRLHQKAQLSDKDNSTENTNARKKALPDKVFVVRESYLTALLEVDHMKSIYNIFFTVLVVFLLNTVCYDYFVEGQVSFGIGTIRQGFRDLHLVMGVWSLLHIPVLGIFYALKLWAVVRQKLKQNQTAKSFWSFSCLIIFITVQVGILYVGTETCLKLDLPYVSASVMLLETTRLIMKVHAFVRTNVSRLLIGKVKADKNREESTVQMPPFSSYVYYLFAPTLIYRDAYPRTKQIRWKFALNRFLEVLAVAFLYSYIYERYIHVHFANYGAEKLTNASLLVKLFGMIMPGFIIFLCAFYLILHAWLNFTAELLRFGDRMFYKDWWTATNYEAYYRNWNVVVHDWLYEYIYKDCYNYVFKGSKVVSSIFVFLISAYMHEHIIGFALQVFYPILFVTFGLIGVVLVFLSKDFPARFGNIFLWFSLIIGSSLLISLYSMEYFARQNCPRVEANSWMEWLMPVSWVCNGMVNS